MLFIFKKLLYLTYCNFVPRQVRRFKKSPKNIVGIRTNNITVIYKSQKGKKSFHLYTTIKLHEDFDRKKYPSTNLNLDILTNKKIRREGSRRKNIKTTSKKFTVFIAVSQRGRNNKVVMKFLEDFSF